MLHGREKTAGCVLAMTCLVKITPIVLLLGLLFAKKQRVLYAWGGFMVCYALLLFFTGWWRLELFFVREILPILSFSAMYSSHSITVYLGTVFFPDILTTRTVFDYFSRTISFSILLITLLLLFIASRRCKERGLFWRDALSLSFYPMLLISPLLEIQHYTCLMPALVFLVHDYLDRRCSHRYFVTCLFFWILLLGGPIWRDLGLFFGMLLSEEFTWCSAGLFNLSFKYLPYEFFSPFFVLILWIATSARILFSHEKPTHEEAV
jgi:hypothetical protein